VANSAFYSNRISQSMFVVTTFHNEKKTDTDAFYFSLMISDVNIFALFKLQLKYIIMQFPFVQAT